MTLENLLAIHKLVRHEASAASIGKLLDAARRNLADARAGNVSLENRFDAGYKAILQCATVALWLRGFRTPTSEPGHHMTAIQSLPKTLGIDAATVIVLDALRKQRNLADYEGDSITEASLVECIRQGEVLLSRVAAETADTRTSSEAND